MANISDDTGFYPFYICRNFRTPDMVITAGGGLKSTPHSEVFCYSIR